MKKLKLIIVSLSIALSVGMIACAQPAQPQTPTITYQYKLDVDSEIGIFDRMEDGSYTLPPIEVTKFSDGVSQGRVAYDGTITINENEFLLYNGKLIIKDSSKYEFATTVTLNIGRNQSDNAEDAVSITFPFRKLHIPVTSVEISQGHSLIFNSGGVSLNGKFLPKNASYQTALYSAVYVIVGGVKITENLSDYVTVSAYEHASGSFVPNYDVMDVGDKICVKAVSVKDNIASNELEVTIEKREVESVEIRNVNGNVLVNNHYEYRYSFFKDNMDIGISVEPYNATYAANVEFTILNPDEVPFITVGGEFGKTLIIDEATFVSGKIVRFYVTVDGIQSNTASISIR